ncbi:ATP-grasp domain-containing protein [Methylomonas sp. LL1]|uniref:ATP-grasp domain-containing protein n=1 Tax=Methylomonas sp. LL1 TaxID=2785785 RepID=UPI0018C42F13|nr:ATP-grasp domain-containing protein [Methylomonas sp. LL1]QPK64135.1 ATP-grasp domain-containing protein [Methylomonas sp. LL1]
MFEFITGGGLAGRTLPASLLAEGGMMLQALLDDLKSLPNLELLLPLDQRCLNLSLPANTRVIPITRADNINPILQDLIRQADLVWPIAPESGGILEQLARTVFNSHKVLLLSGAETIVLCADKLATCRRLAAHALPVVPAQSLSGINDMPFRQCVIKPIDGVGCEGSLIIDGSEALLAVMNGLGDPANYLIQPLLEGQAISLSCLFKQGRGWLLCCNRQQVAVEQNRFRLEACVVNTANPRRDFYQNLVERIALAIPSLWGYVGIDIIETADQGPLILEINPRLTTSYVGIKPATGINVAEQVFHLLDGEPDLSLSNDQPVRVDIH